MALGYALRPAFPILVLTAVHGCCKNIDDSLLDLPSSCTPILPPFVLLSHHNSALQVMAAAKVMVLAPESHLYPCGDNHEQLLVVLRGAVHMTASQSQSSNHSTDVQHPDGTSAVLPDQQQPRQESQTDAASLQTSGSMVSYDSTLAESHQQLPSGSASSSEMQEKAILDARGCAFALPGLLLGSALDVHVTAKTVVEAYSIPWSLIQVGFLILVLTSNL